MAIGKVIKKALEKVQAQQEAYDTPPPLQEPVGGRREAGTSMPAPSRSDHQRGGRKRRRGMAASDKY